MLKGHIIEIASKLIGQQFSYQKKCMFFNLTFLEHGICSVIIGKLLIWIMNKTLLYAIIEILPESLFSAMLGFYVKQL